MKTIAAWVKEAVKRGDSPSEILTLDLEWIATQVRNEALEEAARKVEYASLDWKVMTGDPRKVISYSIRSLKTQP